MWVILPNIAISGYVFGPYILRTSRGLTASRKAPKSHRIPFLMISSESATYQPKSDAKIVHRSSISPIISINKSKPNYVLENFDLIHDVTILSPLNLESFNALTVSHIAMGANIIQGIQAAKIG